jgi:ParB family chromosome partitioning protein
MKTTQRKNKEKSIFMEQSNATGNPTYMEVPIDDVFPSATNPRTVFHEEPLNELADSIKSKGILEPLIVRPKGEKFEIVAGERRSRAARLAGLSMVPVLVSNFTDEEALSAQIDENLHRDDLEPMDEARGYKFLQEKVGLSLDDLALRLHKPVKFIHTRLKLNDLTVPAQKLLDERELPLTHALELVKYDPDTQAKIIKELLFEHSNGDRSVKVFRNFLGSIERNIHALLSRAPFALDDDRLRKDKLKCVDCPARSGAMPTLFDAPEAKDDKCLNSACFDKKTVKFIQITRSEFTKNGQKDKKDKTYKAPVIDTNYYGNWDSSEYEKPIIGYHDKFKVLTSDKDFCEKAEQTIYVRGDKRGTTALVCRDHTCKKHFPSVSQDKSSSSQAELKKKRERREEIIDVKVREKIRRVILEGASETFANSFAFEAGLHRGILPALVGTLWLRAEDNDRRQVVSPIAQKMVGEKVKLLTNSYDFWNTWSPSKLRPADWIEATFSEYQQKRLLFLFSHAHDGEMYHGNYRSQKAIMELAAIYGFNYRLMDAEERLELSNKKNRPQFEKYLEAVREGKKAAIPRLYAETYACVDDVVQKPKKARKAKKAKTEMEAIETGLQEGKDFDEIVEEYAAEPVEEKVAA